MSRRVEHGFDREALTRIRNAAKLTVGDLHRITDISASAIYAWENGFRTPEVHSLASVADALEVRMDVLVPVPPAERMLSHLRVFARMTQTELAAKLGIPTPAYSKIERGERPLPEELVARLTQALTIDDETHPLRKQSINEVQVRSAWQRAKSRPPGTPA